jgi:hypothetical protein
MLKTLTLPKLIRRLLVGLPLAALLVGVMATGVAAGKPGPPPPPFPPTSCGSFDTVLAITMANIVVKNITYPPDGSVVVHLSGTFHSTLTNLTTGKSIDVNASGAETDTYYPDGSLTVFDRGITIGPVPFANLLDPSLLNAANDGTVLFTFDSSGNQTSFSHTGHVTDLCAAVS